MLTTSRGRRPLLRGIAVVATLAAATFVGPGAPTSPHPAGSTPISAGEGDVGDWGTVTGTDGRVWMTDAQGRAITFRGFASKSSDPLDAYGDPLFAAGAARGLKLLRLGVFWQDLEPTEDGYDDGELDDLVATLDRAAAHGFQVIVTMHQDSFGQAFESRGMPAWATRTDGLPFVKQDNWILDSLQPALMRAWTHLYDDPDLRQAQIDVWLRIVDRVKDHPALLGYDLLNEPFGELLPGETLPDAAKRVESTQMTPMYQRLTDAIAGVDPDHWVFIEPPNLNSLGIASSLGEVTGPKVAIAPHMYDAAIEQATYTPGGKIEYDPSFFARWETAATDYPDRHPMPMIVGEWGLARPELPGMEAYVADALDTLERSTSGWTLWAACLGGGYCPFDETGAARPGIGQIFQPYARAIAGVPVSSTFDRDEDQLRVRFVDGDATGPTEIWVDAEGTYPDGWEVTTSDPDATWTSSFDPATGMLSVTTADTGDAHAICVQPTGADLPCDAEDDDVVTSSTNVDNTTPPTTAPPAATAPAATPVAAAPRYTG